MKTIYLHIGLPKTASTYLQNFVFPNFDDNEICYNPAEILSLLRALVESTTFSRDSLLKSKIRIHEILSTIAQDKVLISDEAISVSDIDLNCSRNLDIINEIFPNAKIILILRFQPNWFLALYKQAIHQQRVQNLSQFAKDRNILSPTTDETHGSTAISLNNFDYSSLIFGYQEKYGKNNVHVLFFENLAKDNYNFVTSLCNLLNVCNRTKKYSVHYKSLSALSIFIIIALHNFTKSLSIKIPYNLAAVKTQEYYQLATTPLRLQQIFKPIFFHILVSKFKCKFHSRFNWVNIRNFFQSTLDKWAYVDWDLLEQANLRNQITSAAYAALSFTVLIRVSHGWIGASPLDSIVAVSR